jgi:hypothetical protein
VRLPNVERFVAAFEDTPVEVVVSVRDLGRNMPAMWQESLKNAYTWTWREYLGGVRDENGPVGRHFWRQQAAGRIANKWIRATGTDRTTIVTVPPKGAPRDLLWRRFCDAVKLDGAVGWELPDPANESMGVASSQMLRRLNLLLEGMPFPDYQSAVKTLVAKRVLVTRKEAEEAIGFTVPPWVVDRAHTMRGVLAASGARIVGDLDDLRPVDVPGVDPDQANPDDVLEAALAALEGVVRRHVAVLGRQAAQRSS